MAQHLLPDLSSYADVRFHDFHVYHEGMAHNFSRVLTDFPGIANSFWFEDFILNHSDFIHRSLSKWYFSFYISIAYLISIVVMKRWMRDREPYKMKTALIAWNALLAVFSIMGTIRCFPEFVHVLFNHGLKFSYSQSTYYYVSLILSFICFLFASFQIARNLS